jgi:hypothetical protein
MNGNVACALEISSSLSNLIVILLRNECAVSKNALGSTDEQ